MDENATETFTVTLSEDELTTLRRSLRDYASTLTSSANAARGLGYDGIAGNLRGKADAATALLDKLPVGKYQPV